MSMTRTAPAPAGRRSGRQRTMSATRSPVTTMRPATRRRYGAGERSPSTLRRARAQRAMAEPVLQLLPQRDDLTRVEDRRVRAGDDANEQREREVPHRVAAKEIEREQRQHHGEGGD